MLKRLLITWICCVLLITLLPAAASAAKGTVQVKVVNFPVKVNGVLINNRLAKNPFLVYKNITYVPLNVDMVQELGLLSTWSKDKGLQIQRNFDIVTQPLKKKPYPQNLTVKNSISGSYAATISTFKIQLSGEIIKNSEQVYPFLEFRNVKYIPLTWLNAHTRLHMDIQWNEKEGLAIWSGQAAVLTQIVYDDNEALYVYANRSYYRTYNMMKIAKSLKSTPVWLDINQENIIRNKAAQAISDQIEESEKVIVERINNVLTYQGLELAALRDEDRQEVQGGPLQIDGTLYTIDDRRKLLVVYTFFSASGGGIESPLSRYQLFTIIDGKLKASLDYPHMPDRVIKNADGTVWIASARVRHFDSFYTGSGKLALMDQEGNVHVANDVWNETDVSPIAIKSPTSDQKGPMIVRLYGVPQFDINGLTKSEPDFIFAPNLGRDNYYTVDTALNLKKLPKAPESNDNLSIYKDNKGDLYTINLYSNTLTNWTKNQSKTWIDVELLRALDLKGT
ncbi:hypothetical protein EHS13_04425 [Paenibacillus psychroresistens]|uniref:Copper amine oxidase-like N-terminal domain-containing protein n=1 Tax=Paenibacillus psychroresistens TaxID=1778678 RepID=A0A6B8RFR3_9BACL|nr:hypothetical protein [Paenibacillus psychroresistens]QGQ94206.1 hypothetical protein EHS13_04425 [Paenibacillus psychroresistens]